MTPSPYQNYDKWLIPDRIRHLQSCGGRFHVEMTRADPLAVFFLDSRAAAFARVRRCVIYCVSSVEVGVVQWEQVFPLFIT